MLILTRRVGESLMIGDNIVVTVLGVKGNQIRVGVEAPKETQVHREEIYNKIKDGVPNHNAGRDPNPTSENRYLNRPRHPKGTLSLNDKDRRK